MKYCHENDIMHRDIKLENILVCIDSKGRIYDLKVADFGLACKISDLDEQQYTVAGSVGYMAPEIIMKESYNEKVDVFSLGIILYILATGDFPFRVKG